MLNKDQKSKTNQSNANSIFEKNDIFEIAQSNNSALPLMNSASTSQYLKDQDNIGCWFEQLNGFCPDCNQDQRGQVEYFSSNINDCYTGRIYGVLCDACASFAFYNKNEINKNRNITNNSPLTCGGQKISSQNISAKQKANSSDRRRLMSALRMAYRVLGVNRKDLGVGFSGFGSIGKVVVAAGVSLATLSMSTSFATAQQLGGGSATGAGSTAISPTLTVCSSNGSAAGSITDATATNVQASATGKLGVAIGCGAVASDVQTTALGAGATAAGYYSLAAGTFSNASGIRSTALGVLARAKGDYAVAIGHNSEASGNSSIVLGSGARASAESAFGLGNDAKATAVNATAIGKNSMASGVNSLASGYGANVAGASSVAVGDSSSASGSYSLASGYNATASGASSVALGNSSSAGTAGSIAIGSNAVGTVDNAATGVGYVVAIGSGAQATAHLTVALGGGRKQVLIMQQLLAQMQ